MGQPLGLTDFNLNSTSALYNRGPKFQQISDCLFHLPAGDRTQSPSLFWRCATNTLRRLLVT